LNLSGLHLKGLSRLLEYDPGNLSKFLKGVEQIDVVSAETETVGGLQGVYFYSESDIVVILEAIIFSKIKVEVRKRASDILKRLAAAGFKLAVMLELAPEKLKASINVPAETLAEWHQKRIEGKIVRRSFTDQIKLLVLYAEAQGSTNLDRYYSNYTSMYNKYIIEDYSKLTKIKDKRDRMTKAQLHHIETIEMVAVKVIDDGMGAGKNYKDIYQDVKARVAAIAAVLYIEPAPLLAESNVKLIKQSMTRSLKAS
jgi:hypothetical protein